MSNQESGRSSTARSLPSTSFGSGNVKTTIPFGAVRQYGRPGYPDHHRVETLNPALQAALSW